MLLTWIRIREKWYRDRQRLGTFLMKEDGIGTLEIVLIAAVLIIIAVIFKDWIVDLVKKFIGKASTEADKIFPEES